MTDKHTYIVRYKYIPTGHISVRPIDAYSPKQAVYYFYMSQLVRYGEIRYKYLSIR